MYETFAHTADVGLRVRSPDLDTLLAEAGRAFFSVIVSNPDQVRRRVRKGFQLAPIDLSHPDDVLVDWLSELLYAFESEHLLLSWFHVATGGGRLEAIAEGEPVDEHRHRLAHEIKAVTYHGLKVEPAGDGWFAEVVLDL